MLFADENDKFVSVYCNLLFYCLSSDKLYLYMLHFSSVNIASSGVQDIRNVPFI